MSRTFTSMLVATSPDLDQVRRPVKGNVDQMRVVFVRARSKRSRQPQTRSRCAASPTGADRDSTGLITCTSIADLKTQPVGEFLADDDGVFLEIAELPLTMFSGSCGDASFQFRNDALDDIPPYSLAGTDDHSSLGIAAPHQRRPPPARFAFATSTIVGNAFGSSGDREVSLRAEQAVLEGPRADPRSSPSRRRAQPHRLRPRESR